MDLIIVESPTKAKTISKFIDKKYKIESSFGHIRDLPKNKMGIDITNNFEPEYIIPEKAEKIVANLKKLSTIEEGDDFEYDYQNVQQNTEMKIIELKNKRVLTVEIYRKTILRLLDEYGYLMERKQDASYME